MGLTLGVQQHVVAQAEVGEGRVAAQPLRQGPACCPHGCAGGPAGSPPPPLGERGGWGLPPLFSRRGAQHRNTRCKQMHKRMQKPRKPQILPKSKTQKKQTVFALLSYGVSGFLFSPGLAGHVVVLQHKALQRRVASRRGAPSPLPHPSWVGGRKGCGF